MLRFYLQVELLADESPAVAIRAAEAVSRLSAHSSLTLVMLQAPGILRKVESANLNPVQADFIDRWVQAAGRPLREVVSGGGQQWWQVRLRERTGQAGFVDGWGGRAPCLSSGTCLVL